MRASTAIVLSLFAAVNVATPFSPKINYCEGDKKTVGYCDTLSYVDKTAATANPPSADDCQNTCQNILQDAGDWAVDFQGKPEGYRQRMYQATCGFAMGPMPNASHEFQFDMNNQDIVDIMDEAIRRFASLHGGRVAAEGKAKCNGHEVMWYITPGAV